MYYHRLANPQFAELTPLTLERVGEAHLGAGLATPTEYPGYSVRAPSRLLSSIRHLRLAPEFTSHVLTYTILRQGPLSLEEIQAKEERRKHPRSHTKFVAETGSELSFFFWGGGLPGQ